MWINHAPDRYRYRNKQEILFYHGNTGIMRLD